MFFNSDGFRSGIIFRVQVWVTKFVGFSSRYQDFQVLMPFFGLGLGSKKVGFLLRGFGYPSLLVSLTKTTFSVKTFSMENNYNILMLLTMWEKSIDLARIFLHAPLGRKIVVKKYLFSLMKILVWSFFKFHFPSSLHFLSILFLESNSFFANDS